MLVDEEDNVMCFMTVRTTESEPENWSRLSWTNFPEGLKIHDSIYDSVHSQKLDPTFEFMEVSFRQEAFFAESDAYDSEIDQYFQPNLTKIFEYDDAVANDFFWTSADSKSFFEPAQDPNASSSFKKDADRSNVWVAMLNQVTEDHDMYYANTGDGDICDFESLQKLYEYQPVSKIILLTTTIYLQYL